MEHILSGLSRKYPQLLFPVKAGISGSPEYKDAVCFGKKYHGSLDYSMSDEDRLMCVDTPAGAIDVLLLHDRGDFEKCACALANRCEPKKIPESVGAFYISGLINWEKVRGHLNKKTEDECLVNSFVWNWLKKNRRDFHDRIILLSSGWYSGISPDKVGLSEEVWVEKSIQLRMYHEITHFVSRTRYPKNINAIRDEVFADMIGMFAAFGRCDADLEKLFLGIDGTKILETARLRYYLTDRDIASVRRETDFWISWIEKNVAAQSSKTVDGVLVSVLDEMINTECR